MQHIVIVSNVAHHHSYIRVLIRVFSGCRITLVLNPAIVSTYEGEMVEGGAVSVTPIKSSRVFTRDLERIVDSADMAIFDEMFSLKELLAFVLWRIRPGFYLTVHNCNSWFFPRYSLSPKQNLSSLLRTLILRKTSSVIVVGSNIRDYLQEKMVRKRILYVPFDYPPQSVSTICSGDTGNRLRVVVPGIVSRRRNYEAVLDALRICTCREAVSLVLLGAPGDDYGERILRECRKMIEEGYDIRFFESFLPFETFDHEIARADVLLSAFDVRYRTLDKQLEVYGSTKETGASFLALAYAKPAILPSDYRPLCEIATQVIPYRDTPDIARIMELLAHNQSLLGKYRDHAVQNTLKANLEPIRGQFGLES